MGDEQWELGQEQEQDEEDAKDWDTRPGQCGLGKILGYLPVDVKPKEYEKQKMNSYNIQLSLWPCLPIKRSTPL